MALHLTHPARALTALAAWMAAFSALSGPASAQPAQLAWSAPSGCPRAEYVEQRVASLIAGAEALRPNLAARAELQRARGRFQLTLSLRADDYVAERRLTAASCASLADTAAFLIAVALAPGLTLAPDQDASGTGAPAPSVPAPASGSTTSTSTAIAPDEQVASQSEHGLVARSSPASRDQASEPAERTSRSRDAAGPAPERTRLHASDSESTRPRSYVRWWRLGLLAGLFDAALPAAQAEVGGRVGFGRNALFLELRSLWIAPRARTLRGGPRAYVEGAELSVAACGQWGRAMRAGPCLSSAALWAFGSVKGATEPGREVLLWAALGPSVQWGWIPVRWLEVSAEVGAYLPVSARPRFTVEGAGEVGPARVATVYARAGFGFRGPDVTKVR